MTKKVLLSASVAVGVLILSAGSPQSAQARSAVFGGGPFYSGGTAVMNDLRASGFTTIMLWSIHVNSNGDLVMNDKLVASNGSYVGASTWPGQLATLKQAPTSINRIELSVGSAGVSDWHNIQSLINSQGTGSGSILYRNFQALINATGADAVDDDDEDLNDVTSTVQFGNMIASLGKKVTLCPYTSSGFWQSVKSQLGGTVDRIYLQDYAGGAGNDPASWGSALGMTVDPGLWCRNGSGCGSGDNPSSVQSKMAAWKSSAGIGGGFMWLYDDMQACSSQGTTAQYASAINNAIGPTATSTATRTSTATATRTPTPRATATSRATPSPTSGGTASIVSLSSAFNLNAAYTDGTTFPSTGGTDGVGSAYSSTLLGASLTWSGTSFNFGPANQLNGVRNATVTLPAGQFAILTLLGTGVNGDQLSQTVKVNYTDGTSSTFTQTFSNWLNASQNVAGQSIALTTTYRNKSTGVKDNRAFNLYAYTLSLTSTKTASSLVLPATNNVIVLAATLRTSALATPTATATATSRATATRTATARPTATSTTSAGQCAGVPAFATCTAYANGAKVVFNNTLYHSIASIPSTRDCPPSSPFDPSNDNWWVNDGGC
jgi:hypothetical protein